MILKPNTTASEAAPTITVARSASPRVRNHEPSSRSGFVPETSVPVSFGSSPITTSMAAPNRKPVTTARERNCAIHPMRSSASRRYRAPETSVISATKAATSWVPVMPATATALAATAANPELGPVEI